MALARISPGKRGFEERTFECATCHRTEKLSFAVDPMKPDALVGWRASKSRRTEIPPAIGARTNLLFGEAERRLGGMTVPDDRRPIFSGFSTSTSRERYAQQDGSLNRRLVRLAVQRQQCPGTSTASAR
jgi:hypothetical protein